MKFVQTISLLLLFTLIISCGGQSETGMVGESITLVAESGETGEDLEFSWDILEQPSTSWITVNDLQYSEDHMSATFIPDEPGTYVFSVAISQYGDEVSNQSFSYEIELGEDGSDYDEELTEVTEEEWLESTPEEPEIPVEIPEPEFEERVEPEKVVVKETPPPPPPPKPVKRVVPGSTIPVDKSRFTIQVASRKMLVDAEKVASDLINAGFDAYIQKAYFMETDQIWYRVRVGSYDDMDIAQSVASSIADSYNLATWIDHVRIEQ